MSFHPAGAHPFQGSQNPILAEALGRGYRSPVTPSLERVTVVSPPGFEPGYTRFEQAGFAVSL